MRALRIGHFLSHYPQPGGTVTAVTGLSRALERLGHQVTIYGSRSTAQLAAARDSLDLLVVHGMFNPRNVAVARAAARAGLPYVVCPHDPYHPAVLASGRLRKRLYGWLWEKPLLAGAAAVQVLAPEQVPWLRAYGYQGRVFVTPNGFDPEEIPAPAARSEGPDFLYLGRLDMYQKGLDLLLAAWALGLREGRLAPGLRFHFVGRDRRDRRRLERLAEHLGLGALVRFCGAVPERWSAIASCGVLVLPSRFEGFGLTVLEAMAAAKPALVSARAGIAGFVRQAGAGFVVEPDAPSICAGLVEALARRQEWTELGRRGREFACERLTWNRVAACAAESYQKCLA
jgi:glycosyltransferase involved in cell wall biosynthesis